MRPWETYVPNARQSIFHAIPAVGPKLVKGAIGGAGGGKSTCIEQEMIEVMMRQPKGMSVALRKSKAGRAELSIQKDFKDLLVPQYAEWVSTESKFVLRSNGHELYISSGEDFERFGSVPFCNGFLQEAQELKYDIFWTISMRLRHSAGMLDGQPAFRLYFDARGVGNDHWINKEFIEKAWDVDDPEEYRMSVANPDYVYVRFKTSDNRDHLPPGYEEGMRREHAGDLNWQAVFIDGKIGHDVEGQAVYGDAFDNDRHVAGRIIEDASLPILRGWDFGYRAPGVVFCQYTRSGRLLVLRELAPKNLSTESLVNLVVAGQAEWFPRRDAGYYYDFCDAAGEQVQSTSYRDIETIEEMLHTTCTYRKARIETGLNVVRKLMLGAVKVGGRLVPRFMVDSECPVTLSAMNGGYYYPADRMTDGPIKGGSYTAVCDGIRYIAQEIVEEGFVKQLESVGYVDSQLAFGKY